jgi:hypothetical protein
LPAADVVEALVTEDALLNVLMGTLMLQFIASKLVEKLQDRKQKSSLIPLFKNFFDHLLLINQFVKTEM